MKIFKILITILCFFVSLTNLVCIHDKILKKQTMVYINDQHHHKQRLLQNLGYGRMRIHQQYNTTTISESDSVGKNLRKIMNIISQFWSRTIQVDYAPALSFQLSSPYNLDSFRCMTFTVPRQLLENPVPNKDFGLLIEAEDDGDSGVTAYSYPCASSKTTKRPLWGFIHWNKNYLSFNPINFQENIHIGIHQILHVLGFSQILYPNYKNSQIYVTVNGVSYLNGPFLRQQILNQYNCEKPLGMTLQMGGGQGTALSHWSRKVAGNQLMTAGVSVNNPTISYITLALLQQTGWYRKIYKNLARFINFGYRKGCGVLDPNNCNSNQYCKIAQQKRPDYDRTALGYCKNESLSNCLYIKFYSNFICTDPNYAQKSLHAEQGVISITGQKGGMRSRCFSGDLRTQGSSPTKYPFRCYEVICSPTRRTLTIRIGNTYGFCMFPNQVLKINGYEGTLRCPDSFTDTCAVQRCPQQCNGNGICLGGRCLCDPSYSSPACSQLSSFGFASKTPIFLSSKNNNCLVGSYRTQFGDCQLCQKGCLKCNQKGCQLCNKDALPINGKCPQ